MSIISELGRVYRRYLVENVVCRFPPAPLGTETGDPFGHVEDCVFTRDSLRLRGWTLSHRLRLDIGEASHPVARRIQRGDVVMALGARMIATGNQHGRVGFEITVPRTAGPVRLVAEDMPDAGPWQLPLPTAPMIRAERRRAQAGFARSLLKAAPLGLRYLVTGRKRADRDGLRALMGLDTPPGTSPPLDSRVLALPSRHTGGFPATTIIMPVYNAFDLLTQAVARVDRHTDVPWHLVLVEDASPDARVRPWLAGWAAQRPDRVTLLANETNLGFIGSVNRGLALAARRGGPVILLNSDALVPEGWASRLLGPMLDDAQVASVTPMSNDATILSVPWIAGRATLDPGAADLIDAAARSLSPQAQARVPTGVGFCMAMSRAALDRVPALDPAFGRGYGEEVDWCRRTANLGMTHLGIGNLFVEHRGGESFGSEDKLKALESSARIISIRYPQFDAEVQRFIAADPLLTARLCLALAGAAAADPEPLPVYLAHSLGGGADHWLAAGIARRGRQGKPTAVIRVGGLRRFRIELHSGDGVLAGETDDIDLARGVILKIPRRRIIYSCGVGDERPWELPDLLCDLAACEGSRLEILFHDYFPVSPSLNLLNADGRYTGVPPVQSTDSAHRFSAGGFDVPLETWRTAWGKAIRRADAVIVFSSSSALIVEAAWPEARGRIACQPHRKLIDVPALPKPQGKGPGVIGVLGAIGAVKGAQIVSDLAYHLNRLPNAPELIVIGEFDHKFPLPSSVKVTGRYDPATLPEILALHGVTAWLMPSVWPETYSFTTREMLATGLPVMAFDLGAQGDVVREAANGHIVPPDPALIHDHYQRLRSRD